jgi:hypothetical protein
MREIEANPDLVAFCGLYCGACRKYLREKCPGCRENQKASWCSVRSCCLEKNLPSCAGCAEFPEVKACRKFDNWIARLIGVILRSDRAACIAQIKRQGLDGHARCMAENRLQTIRKR